MVYGVYARFVVEEAGTFWYHSHMDMQRLDGLFGALIVHDFLRPSYASFIVQVNDWLHMDSDGFATSLIGPGDPLAVYECKCLVTFSRSY